MTPKKINRFLPLSEASYYILLALRHPQHGYAVMQETEQASQGSVKLAPGTLYGALTNLEGQKLIQRAGQDGRRKIYQITELGTQVLTAHIKRLQIMLQAAKEQKHQE
jgi:DNA-binding PadR family transcriptional regulator